jgi:DNA polymerase III subunit gamma/tau
MVKKKAGSPKRRSTRSSKSSKASANPVELVSRNLAAKYRPKTLAEFVGQPKAKKTMEGWVKSGKFPGAIMVTGSTGSGKTTIARLVARYTNGNPDDPNCSYCQYDTDLPDLETINCGEKSGVDDIRALIKQSKMAGRYKRRIILLDEVHLLSDKAMQALLIPLEEPSPKTIWILCTTDPEKVKSTVANRCVRVHMEPMATDDIYDRLVHILKKEGIKDTKPFDTVIDAIAEFSNGIMRKAISDLDGFLSAVQDGEADLDAEEYIRLFQSSSEVEMDKLAVSLLVQIALQDMPKMVKILEKSGDPKSLLFKLSLLLEFLIKYTAGAVKWQHNLVKTWYKAVRLLKQETGEDLQMSLALALHIASKVGKIQHEIFTVPALRPSYHIMTSLCDLVVQEVFLEINGNKPRSTQGMDITQDPEEENDSKRSKSKRSGSKSGNKSRTSRRTKRS